MTILFILITILLFGTLIATHEFGHFITAKTLGMRVEGFVIGVDPKLLSKTRGGIVYSLRALPTEGFCSMEGEGETLGDPRSFSDKPAWKKFIILVAGTFLNFVTGLVILLVLFSVAGGPSAPVVNGYLPGAEGARETGLLPGDEFYRIDGYRIYFQSDAILFPGRAREDVAIEMLRGGRRFDLGTLYLPCHTLTNESGQQSLRRRIMVRELREAEPLGTLRNAWYQSIDYVRTIWLSLGDLIRGVISLNDMTGPIGTFAMASGMGQQGAAAARMAGALLSIFGFVALIAINLAATNLPPIPALDGGQVLFLLAGGIYYFPTHRRIDQGYLGYVNMVGFFCLITPMVMVAASDVSKLIL